MERERTSTEDKNPFNVIQENKGVTSPFVAGGFDSAELNGKAYLAIDDEMQELENKINKTKTELSNLEKEISSALNIDDMPRLEFLESKKHLLQEELKSLNACYFNRGTTFRIANYIKKINDSLSRCGSSLIDIIKQIMFNNFMFKQFKYSSKYRTSFIGLSDINRNVDELVDLKVPFGGITSRYANLLNYKKKVNFIYSKISANVNKLNDSASNSMQNGSGMGNFIDVNQ